MPTHKINHCKGGARTLLGLSIALAGAALADAKKMEIDVPSQKMGPALMELSQESGVQVIVPSKPGFDVVLPSVSGNYTIDQALDILLQDTRFYYEYISEDAVVIRQGNAEKKDQAAVREVDEEILITANRRKQSVQDVLFSVQALSGERLEQDGVQDFTDLASGVPGLSVVGGGQGRNNISIRGIAAFQQGSGTTSVYINETPISNSFFQSELALFDLERVEVLRGPQGTLFGEASLGGTLRIITKKPDTSGVAGKLDITSSKTRYGSNNEQFNGMLNLPLSDSLAVRGVISHRDLSGYVDNVTLGQNNINHNESFAGRLAARYELSENTAFELSSIYEDSDRGSTNFINPVISTANLQVNRLPQPEFQDDQYRQHSLTVTHDFENFQLFSSTSKATRDLVFRNVQSSGRVNNLSNDLDVVSQEVRLVSTNSDQLEWVTGVFYAETENTVANNFGRTVIDRTRYAAFGDVTYYFNSWMYGSLGLRYTSDETDFTTSIRRNSDYSEWTPRVSLGVKPSDDSLLYVTVSKGFRAGGVNSRVPADSPSSTFDADFVWNYELGAKTTWLDGRLTVNGAIYYLDWKDIQLPITFPDVGPFAFGTANVGVATSKGYELEVAANITDNLSLGITSGYIDAKSGNTPPPIFGSPIVNAGDRIPGVTDGNFSARLEYNQPIGDYELNVLASVAHVGDAFLQPGVDARELFGNYTTGDLRIALSKDRWEITLFADNITNKRGVSSIDPAFVIDFDGEDQRQFLIRPRTIGLKFSLNYE